MIYDTSLYTLMQIEALPQFTCVKSPLVRFPPLSHRPLFRFLLSFGFHSGFIPFQGARKLF